ncbi:MAG TPA: PDZ domain-containing protein [Tepidisphaeraceae bacterium]
MQSQHKMIARYSWPMALLMLVAAAPLRADIDPKLARELYEKLTPSLVVVQYTFDGELGRRELTTAGVVVSDDGLVIVSGSITPPQIPDEQMKDFKVIIPGDEETELDAEFQGRDDRTNLSLVKVKEKRNWTPLKFEDVPLSVGDPVVSIGLLPKDAGYKPYLTSATVSALLRGPVPQVLVSGGGLGGVGSPVLTPSGQVVGVVHTQDQQSPLLNDPRDPMGSVQNPPRFFVPARDFLISLSDPPTPQQPLVMPHIGVAQLSGLNKEVAEYFGLKNVPAVQVGDVIPNFPAAKAGIKSGDVIVKANGQPLDRGDEPDETPQIMTRKLMRMKPGQTVTFTILTGKGQPTKDIPVTLEERPRQANKAKRFFADDLGFTVREIVFEDTYTRRLPADTKGVVVALIKPSSSAQTAKLQMGDLVTRLNQTPVKDLEQFKTQYESFRKDNARDAVVLEVMRGVSTQIIRIEPPQ